MSVFICPYYPSLLVIPPNYIQGPDRVYVSKSLLVIQTPACPCVGVHRRKLFMSSFLGHICIIHEFSLFTWAWMTKHIHAHCIWSAKNPPSEIVTTIHCYIYLYCYSQILLAMCTFKHIIICLFLFACVHIYLCSVIWKSDLTDKMK